MCGAHGHLCTSVCPWASPPAKGAPSPGVEGRGTENSCPPSRGRAGGLSPHLSAMEACPQLGGWAGSRIPWSSGLLPSSGGRREQVGTHGLLHFFIQNRGRTAPVQLSMDTSLLHLASAGVTCGCSLSLFGCQWKIDVAQKILSPTLQG